MPQIRNVRLEFDEESKSIKVHWEVDLCDGFLPTPRSIVLNSYEEANACELLREYLSEDELIGVDYFWLDVGKIHF
jgi:hypothetical protein